MLRRRCQRLCLRRPQRSSAERDAYAMFTKAPPAKLRAALERVGGRLWRLADHRRQCRGRQQRRHQPYRRHGGRRGLSVLAEHHCRFRAGRRRHQFRRRQRLGSGRSDLFQAGVYARHTMGAAYIAGALAYGWQDITTNRTVTLAGPISCRRSSTPTRSRAASKAAIVLSRPGSAASASRPMRPLSSPRSTCRPMPNRPSSAPIILRWPTAPRASPIRAANSASAPTSPLRCRMAFSRCAAVSPGHMITIPTARSAPPSSRCRVRASSSTARRRPPLRADHSRHRAQMDQRLVDRRDVRRRVLQRDQQLRRQGCGALSVVRTSRDRYSPPVQASS